MIFASKIFAPGFVYKFQCGLCNESYCEEYVTHLAVRSGEYCHLELIKGYSQDRTVLPVIIYQTFLGNDIKKAFNDLDVERQKLSFWFKANKLSQNLIKEN